MSNIAIRVENLSKRYRIGLEEEINDTLIGSLNSWVRSPIRNFRRLRKLSRFGDEDASDIIWALRDVSFEVERGEVLGIIGRNGAGKSTLLKILSQITEPSGGRAVINGRVASLLEVGTGFHSELTGRENVYLNGTVLGMTRREVGRKFDEIVAFSGVERFIDTPVKRYSSGMRVRLAFAVAAHLEPEVLLVDEVLAVGDANFQKKCLGKMEEVANQGRTILFVSHDMAAVQNLCGRAIYLEQGQIELQSTTSEVIDFYLDALDSEASVELSKRVDRRGTGALRFVEARLLVNGDPARVWRSGENVGLDVFYTVRESACDCSLDVHIGIDDARGVRVAHVSNETVAVSLRTASTGQGVVSIHFDRLRLVPGQYRLTLYAKVDGLVADWIHAAVQLEVEQGDFYFTGKLPPQQQGQFLMDYQYETETLESAQAAIQQRDWTTT